MWATITKFKPHEINILVTSIFSLKHKICIMYQLIVDFKANFFKAKSFRGLYMLFVYYSTSFHTNFNELKPMENKI